MLAQDGAAAARRRRGLGLRDQVGRRPRAGLRGRRSWAHAAAAATRTSPQRYPELAGSPSARRAQRDARRRGRRPRRGGAPELPAASSGGWASPRRRRRGARRGDTPVDYIALRPPPSRRAPRPATSPTPSAASCSTGSGSTGRAGSTPRATASAGARTCSRPRARQGLEGVVAKRSTAPTARASGRGEWIKARVWRRQEFVIGGHIPGEGRRGRAGRLAAGRLLRQARRGAAARARSRSWSSPAASARA